MNDFGCEGHAELTRGCPECALEKMTRRAEDAERRCEKLQTLADLGQESVDVIVHYRNLAIGLGAKPEMMLGKGDRDLARHGVSLTEDTPGYWSMKDSIEDMANVWAAVDKLESRAQRAVDIVDRLLQTHQYGHGEKWNDAWAAAREFLDREG